jgi:hypothetical protein
MPCNCHFRLPPVTPRQAHHGVAQMNRNRFLACAAAFAYALAWLLAAVAAEPASAQGLYELTFVR